MTPPLGGLGSCWDEEWLFSGKPIYNYISQSQESAVKVASRVL